MVKESLGSVMGRCMLGILRIIILMGWGFINGKGMAEFMKERCISIRCMAKGSLCGRMERCMRVCLCRMKGMAMGSIGGVMVECTRESGEQGCKMEKGGSQIKKESRKKERGRWGVELVG
jgi:hypothetical protein